MTTVGAYEAKTHLPQLLERVAKGERIQITKHGVPVAELVPVNTVTREERLKAIDALERFSAGHCAGVSIRSMIDEGRL